MGSLDLSPQTLIAKFIALVIGMTIHEFSHAWVATLMGDPTPRQEGRLTLNPLVHMNWLGFVLFAIVGFGMLGQTPVSPRRMRHPRWGAVAAYAAGPLSNLLIAVVFAFVLRLLMPAYLAGNVPGLAMTIVQTIVYMNVLLCLFNFIPLFPLDGWRVVEVLLPRAASNWWSANAQPSSFLLMLLILLSLVPPGYGVPNILGTVIGQPTGWITSRLLGFI